MKNVSSSITKFISVVVSIALLTGSIFVVIFIVHPKIIEDIKEKFRRVEHLTPSYVNKNSEKYLNKNITVRGFYIDMPLKNRWNGIIVDEIPEIDNDTIIFFNSIYVKLPEKIEIFNNTQYDFRGVLKEECYPFAGFPILILYVYEFKPV